MSNARTQSLQKFVRYAKSLAGDEKGEAQVFLDRLFQGFGHEGYHEVGAVLEHRIKSKDRKGTAFADLVWKPLVLVEMKKRGENLAKHYRQAFDYWAQLVPRRPRWVLLCNFDEFWVYDFETQMDVPRAKVSLDKLATNYGPLAFMFPEQEEPVFHPDSTAVTQQAAGLLADCFTSLVERGVSGDTARRFTMQIMTALFAQNINLLDRYLVTRVLEDCKASPRVSYDLLWQLFNEMNTPGITSGGRFKGVQYFNGGLFAQPARVELTKGEMALLLDAASSDWSQVQPEIFGTLFEHSLDHNPSERHMTGAHFTSPADIMKIVGPTICEPWRTLIDGASTQRALQHLLARMQRFKILDPACGSGNFLYIAYRELKRLEARIWERIAEMSRKAPTSQMSFGFVTASQFYGMDVNPFAIELAKVTMMIGRKLAIDELRITEHALPLGNLDSNFQVGDALVNDDGTVPRWEPSDVIIGNPPFLDARKITMEHGREYTNRLRNAYSDIPGRADYCVYWFRRAHDEIPDWSPDDQVSGRVGLVGTNTIRQNYSREGGLDYVVANRGVITDAVSSQVWTGKAAVHVSIANWVKGPYEGRRVLQEQLGDNRNSEWARAEVAAITSALTSKVDVSVARDLDAVTRCKLCFEGQQPGHKGFRIGLDVLRAMGQKDAKLAEITFQYMIGDSLLIGKHATDPEFVIDFGDSSILDAAKHPAALEHIRKMVLPKWQSNAQKEEAESGSDGREHQRRLKSWWKLKRRRSEMLEAMSGLSRYVACVRHTKRPVFVFLDARIRPDSALTVFAFDDDYSFGILQSSVHWEWFLARCSSLKRDFRYTNETVFDSFPWPQSPTLPAVMQVARRAQELRAVRAQALDGLPGGMRALYKGLEDPGDSPLKTAHQQLDLAVMKAYGFNEKKDVLTQILDLNRVVADAGSSAVGPGIPAVCRDRSKILSVDCIRPYLDED